MANGESESKRADNDAPVTTLPRRNGDGREDRGAGSAEVGGDLRIPPPIRIPVLPKGEDRYVAIELIGQGGMGRVEAVSDRALGRVVARKTSTRDNLLIVAEARTCSQLEHPSILPVYDVGFDEQGNAHYTMRIVRGRTLREVLLDRIERKPSAPSLAQVLGVVRQVCLAADYAHSRGVVHRDLKPDNILLGEFGEVSVLDWGVAHITADSDVERGEGGAGELEIIGSPGYMAPEQLGGAPIDPRTDVFALGVILYEALTGILPYSPREMAGLGDGFKPIALIPQEQRERLGLPRALDQVVAACLAIKPAERLTSARRIADEIETYLDRERDRAERLRDADILADEGEQSQMVHDVLADEARRCQRESEDLLDQLPPWATLAQKQGAWDIAEKGRLLAAEAARALARSETAFTQAIGRVSDHSGARKGLTAISYRQFELAEEAGDTTLMARHIDVARAYDDGTLALELADQAELVVDTSVRGLRASISRYEENGWLFTPSQELDLKETPTDRTLLRSGSYLVVVRAPHLEIRYPVLLRRTMRYRLHIRIPGPEEIPEGMILVPGGPFLARRDARGERRTPEVLPDFAIGRFPVTLREYCPFLDSLDETQRARRTPRSFTSEGESFELVERMAPCAWTANPRMIEGPMRDRVPEERYLDIPVYGINWYDAFAYAVWLAKITGRPYRLPSDLEWEKAARGADGRLFPMGSMLDPAFAKRRESRPESFQPEPIAAFELDESPYGVRDLAGGIGDLTSTAADGLPPPRPMDEGSPAADERQILWRGGNWGATAVTRHAMRYTQPIRERTQMVGFRLALTCEASESQLSAERMPADVPGAGRATSH